MQVRHYGLDYFWEYSGFLDFLVTQIEFRNGVFSVLSIVVVNKMPPKNINIQLSWPSKHYSDFLKMKNIVNYNTYQLTGDAPR